MELPAALPVVISTKGKVIKISIIDTYYVYYWERNTNNRLGPSTKWLNYYKREDSSHGRFLITGPMSEQIKELMNRIISSVYSSSEEPNSSY